MISSRAKGIAGESAAAKYIAQQGGMILERNYTVRGGEIDIIFRDGDTTVFCEVKSRNGVTYGTPAEAVDYRKKYRISRAAIIYAKSNCLMETKLRFDIIEILCGEIIHIKNAFDCAVNI